MDQINELVKVMAKRFADKVQNKKEHDELSKQIRNLYDLLMNRQPTQETDEEAMFSKKPF